MARLHTKIEEYVGRKIDFSQEVIIELNDNDEHYINGWNIEGTAQPTDAQLNAVESDANATETVDKLNYLRKIRNQKLAETDWVVIKEEEGGSVSNTLIGKHTDKHLEISLIVQHHLMMLHTIEKP